MTLTKDTHQRCILIKISMVRSNRMMKLCMRQSKHQNFYHLDLQAPRQVAKRKTHQRNGNIIKHYCKTLSAPTHTLNMQCIHLNFANDNTQKCAGSIDTHWFTIHQVKNWFWFNDGIPPSHSVSLTFSLILVRMCWQSEIGTDTNAIYHWLIFYAGNFSTSKLFIGNFVEISICINHFKVVCTQINVS